MSRTEKKIDFWEDWDKGEKDAGIHESGRAGHSSETENLQPSECRERSDRLDLLERQQEKQQIKRFLMTFVTGDLSLPKLFYDFHRYIGLEEEVLGRQDLAQLGSDRDLGEKKRISEADLPAAVNLMRKSLLYGNTRLLREKLLQEEEASAELIKAKYLTSANDLFLLNALDFFQYGREDYTSWLWEHYMDLRSPLAKSLSCVFLGLFAGREKTVFFMDQTLTLADVYKDEDFYLGPVYAVQEIYDRFYRDMEEL